MDRVIARALGSFPGFCGGQPVPIGARGETVTTTRDDITRLGRFMTFGDAVPRILAQLRDGRTVQLMNADNSREVQNWLRREMKRVPWPHTDRHIAWSTAWGNEAAR